MTANDSPAPETHDWPGEGGMRVGLPKCRRCGLTKGSLAATRTPCNTSLSDPPVGKDSSAEELVDDVIDATLEVERGWLSFSADEQTKALYRITASKAALSRYVAKQREEIAELTVNFHTTTYANQELTRQLERQRETTLTPEKVGAWIAGRWANRSLANTPEAAQWRVLLAAFWDVTRDEAYAEQGRRPDRPQWDIVSLRSALENWGHHHDWCELGPTAACNCGLSEALKIGQYATLDPNGYEPASSSPLTRGTDK